MAFGLLQDHLGDVEERVGAAGHLDLARERLDPFVVGDEGEGDLGQRRRGFPARQGFARLATAPKRTVAPTGAITAGPASSTLGAWSAGAGSIVASTGASVVSSRPGRRIPPWWPRPPPVAPAVGTLYFALIMGVLGGGRLLRPSGQKELFKI
jgi:hypothetical protein